MTPVSAGPSVSLTYAAAARCTTPPRWFPFILLAFAAVPGLSTLHGWLSSVHRGMFQSLLESFLHAPGMIGYYALGYQAILLIVTAMIAWAMIGSRRAIRIAGALMLAYVVLRFGSYPVEMWSYDTFEANTWPYIVRVSLRLANQHMPHFAIGAVLLLLAGLNHPAGSSEATRLISRIRRLLQAWAIITLPGAVWVVMQGVEYPDAYTPQMQLVRRMIAGGSVLAAVAMLWSLRGQRQVEARSFRNATAIAVAMVALPALASVTFQVSQPEFADNWSTHLGYIVRGAISDCVMPFLAWSTGALTSESLVSNPPPVDSD